MAVGRVPARLAERDPDGRGDRREGHPALEGVRSLIRPIEIRLEDDSGHVVDGTMWDAGRSTGVVVTHGILASRKLPAVVRTSTELAADHDVLAIDARGHGSDAGRFSWGREEWRGVTAAARRLAEAGRQVAAVGFSFGGYHSVRAVLEGAPIERLVLVGAPVDLAVVDHFPLGAGFWRHVPRFLRRRRSIPRLEWPGRLRERAIDDGDLARVRAPALVLHGTADWIVSRRHALRYAASIPGSRLVEIPAGLHAEYLVESHPDAVFEEIAEWLR